ncbi:hypothetical protein C4D60_Mb06t02580 [Musa balbisiana]|uniref:Uncharacterized protein n=1 Tax=Musa balbisiana TaxID=52838 RepID=A0A4V4H3L9_MUSBA|nr:hypothetical protein C4D60_Mb06t02580 [Musa balbisiana]
MEWDVVEGRPVRLFCGLDLLDALRFWVLQLHRLPLTATLWLAAACSSAGVTVLFLRDVDICKKNPELSRVRYTISVAMAFSGMIIIPMSYCKFPAIVPGIMQQIPASYLLKG